MSPAGRERGDPAARPAPIGVFDSGVGGLTVLRAIRRRLPAESTLYLGDTARVPYGPKSPATVRRYAEEAADFLVARGVKAMVVACNTATARAEDRLAERLDIPVVGVVEPGAREAARVSRTGVIGVIGTRGTIESGVYEAALRTARPDARVVAAACPLFVALVEEGWTEGPVARMTAETYLEPLLEEEVDTLVLGCTHYPLLEALLAKVAGPEVSLVDSAAATAAALEALLGGLDLLASPDSSATTRYAVTDDPERFRGLAGRFLREPVRHLERVSLEK